jgi:3-hydroxybutyrate dehydrogenase
MNNKVVFITGAATGIGFEMAREFSKAGYSVIISDLHVEKLNAAVYDLRNEQSDISGVVCDVSDYAQLENALEESMSKFGRIDVLINNAGLQFISPVEDFPLEKFEHMLSVMLVAPFVAAKYLFPGMKSRKYGRIINMASVNGLVGFAGKAAYNSAKHGIVGLTRVLALEGAGFNITSNALCPGYVETDLVRHQLSDLAISRNVSVDKVLEDVIYPLVPQKRLLDVREISRYALFLASEDSAGITGQAVVIDGGYTAQ